MMNYTEAIGLARYLLSAGISLDDAVNNPAIPDDLRIRIRETLKEEETIILQPARMIVDDEERIEWLNQQDRSEWHYWPALRQYLLITKGWSNPSVQSLDRETDRILEQLAPPNQTDIFDRRGLVLGYVQSGKTANYTSLIAKAADSGYRLIVVLAGIDNGLRLQTNRRLKRELVGVPSGRGVPLPPVGLQWHEFTLDDLHGDFQRGNANSAALQGSQPVLLVVKKNGTVLRRLLTWLDSAPEEIMRTIPLMVIDDEADLASVDTRGSYQLEGESIDETFEDPTVINGLIRGLLNRFHKKVYVAYTATPFANILIPHNTYDPNVSDDLYPRNFIVDLPKPYGYFGAEELFGRMDGVTEDQIGGLDVVRHISDDDLNMLQQCQLPPVMEMAMLSFVLSGATRIYRLSTTEFPATMLVHISLRIVEQFQIRDAIDKMFNGLRDEWRYNRNGGIRERLRTIWEKDFVPVTKQQHPDLVIDFDALEQHIGSFFESIQIRILNSLTGDVLDYEMEPTLKAIAIGGNKLSRGLTLEGLLISVFVRRTVAYDTLMQMGRWFGFREGYEDLTRIYTTAELDEWFSDLAFVEHRLREDIRVYEEQQLTPLEVGMRIKVHPTLQVTSSLKRRFASVTTISQSYSASVEQTFKFPLKRPEDLAYQAEHNLSVVKEFLSQLEKPKIADKGPVWSNVPAGKVIEFLRKFLIDERARSISLPLINGYINRQELEGELIRWTVAICGLETVDKQLGEVDWGLGNTKIRQISRTRFRNIDSIGTLTSASDELIGLSEDELKKVEELKKEGVGERQAARRVRSPTNGLIMLYPISRYSKPMSDKVINRQPLYENPKNPLARDLIGIAISFPSSNHPQPVEAYLEGTIKWRPVE